MQHVFTLISLIFLTKASAQYYDTKDVALNDANEAYDDADLAYDDTDVAYDDADVAYDDADGDYQDNAADEDYDDVILDVSNNLIFFDHVNYIHSNCIVSNIWPHTSVYI
jgi:hypothetical protein